SPSGEYLVISLGQDVAALWQRSADKYTPLFSDSTLAVANDVNDSGIVVGAYSDSMLIDSVLTEVLTAGYWKEGVWYPLPYPDGYKVRRHDLGSIAYGISADGRVIVGLIHPIPTDDNNKDAYTACVWKDGKFDRYYQIPWSESTGGRPNGIAGDGKSAAGFAEKIINDIQYAPRAPMLFGEGDTAVPISSDLRCAGEMFALNYDGSKGVGSLPGGPFLWDKASNDIKYLGFLRPSHKDGVAVDLSENNTVVGYTFEMMPDSRRAFIWKEDLGILDLTTYATEVYGLDLEGNELLQAISISADGRTIYGNTLSWTPFMLVLDGEILPTVPNTVNVDPLAQGKSVEVTWRRPVENGMKHIGYNVYRDESKLNKEMLPKTILQYIDSMPTEGVHCYAVSAVFDITDTILESKLSKSACIQVLGSNCYAIQTTSSNLKYNQIYTVNWALPTAYLSKDTSSNTMRVNTQKEKRSDAQIKKIQSKELPNQDLALAPQRSYKETPDTVKGYDFVERMKLETLGEASVAALGEYIYAASWDAAGIYKYDLHGNYIEMFAPSCGMLDEITTDGTYLYGVNSTNSIYKIDVNQKEVIDTILVDQEPTHICYIPSLDNNKGGFEYGDATDGFLCTQTGAFIDTAFSNALAVSGTVYYNGFLYAMEQSGRSSFKAQINQYSLETKQFTGLTIDLADFPQLSEIPEAYGGGLAVGRSLDGALCLMAILQLQEGNCIVMIELEKPVGLTGYNVYKDGQKIASKYPYRNYQQILNEAGTYDYYITAVWGDCESDTSTHQKVTIESKGICAPPTNVKAKSTFNHIDITWDKPEPSQTQKFIGYILYNEKGEKLNENFLTSNRYTSIVAGEGTYKYTVEAFYASSCEAKSDTVSVDVAFVGECLPVNNITGQYLEKGGVNLSWEPPYFDKPIAMRYDDGIFADAIGMTEGGEFMAAVGWLKEDMTLYKDFVMVGMEAFIAAEPRSISLLVIVDDVIMLDQNIKVNTLKIGEFNYIELEHPIKFEAPNRDFAIGFRIDNMPKEFPLGIDAGPAKIGYGDLISTNNAETWESTNLGNWLMAAAITKYRDISPTAAALTGTKISSFQNLDPDTKSVNKLGRTALPFFAQSKATAYTLKGYNVYKENKKLNEALLTTNTFADKNVKAGESITYQIASVWGNCDEIKTDFTIMCTGIETDDNTILTVYPNPTASFINIQTTTKINRIRLFDMTGKEILQQTNANRMDVSNVNTGLYLLKVETKDKTYTKKINILR
ncbi:MAG: T9SS type A sorting domain-containing protein, partial [Bacteroidales bacterium]